MTASTAPSRGGLSITAVLGIVFIALKLTGNIGWSWLWVLAPFWGPWAIVLSILLVGVVLAGVLNLIRN